MRLEEGPQKLLFKIWDQYLFNSHSQEKGIFRKHDSGFKTTKVKFVSTDHWITLKNHCVLF